ncbi:MAG: DUF4214 domain-containing protein [Sulfurimonas sp.]|jgi:hypothetical protein
MVSINDVCKLYVATFNRAPDAAGLDYWVNNSGLTIEEIAQSFFDQSETQALYPAETTTADFVTSVYENLFNRAPDAAGLDYWVGDLDSGAVSKQNFILAVMNGALNTSVSQDATILENKQNVGLSFVNNNLDDVELAKTVMAEIDSSEDSVLTATAIISAVAAPVGTFTSEIVSSNTFYFYDDDPQSSYFSAGKDSMAMVTFNPDSTITSIEYTASFGSSQWETEEIPLTLMQTWSIENGRLIISGYEEAVHWVETTTMIYEVENQLLLNKSVVNYYSDGIVQYVNKNILVSDDPVLPRTGYEVLLSVGGDFYYAGESVDYEVFVSSTNVNVSTVLGGDINSAFIINVFDTPDSQTITGTSVNDVFNWRGGNDTIDGAGGGSDWGNGGCDAIWLNVTPATSSSMVIDTSVSGVISLVDNGSTLVQLVKNQDGSVDISANGSTLHATNIELFNSYTVPQDGSSGYNITIDLIGTQSGTFDASF